MAGEYRSLKKQHYLNLIKGCASSGKNKQQWCSENGIKYSTFMRWQALLRDEVADQVMEQQTIVPVKIAPPIVSAPHPDTALPQEIHIRKGEVSISLPCCLPAAYILEIIKGLA